MSTILTGRDIRRDETRKMDVLEVAPEQVTAARVSQMVVFGSIWTAVIAYFALRTVLG